MTLLAHLELECPANIFPSNYSNTASDIEITMMALALSFSKWTENRNEHIPEWNNYVVVWSVSETSQGSQF